MASYFILTLHRNNGTSLGSQFCPVQLAVAAGIEGDSLPAGGQIGGNLGTVSGAFQTGKALSQYLPGTAFGCGMGTADVDQTGPLLTAAVPVSLGRLQEEGICPVRIAAAAGNTGCRINPCHSSEFPSLVTRPPYSVLDKTKIKNTFDIDIPHWRESMEYCIKRIKANNR